MWILIIVSYYISSDGNSSTNVRVAPSIATTEISSRERCIKAAEFTKKQAYIYNAFCVQK